MKSAFFFGWIQLYHLLEPLNLSRGLKVTPGSDASGAERHGLGVPAEPTDIQLNMTRLSFSISAFQAFFFFTPYVYQIFTQTACKFKRWWTPYVYLLLGQACCLPKVSKGYFGVRMVWRCKWPLYWIKQSRNLNINNMEVLSACCNICVYV